MRRPLVHITIAAFMLALPGFTPRAAIAQTATPPLYHADAGPFTPNATDETWHDAARKRDIPVRIFKPAPPAAPGGAAQRLPVIIFSHGLWASRGTYAYFCRHLASHGYLVIAPSHPGSDTNSLRAGRRNPDDEPPAHAPPGPSPDRPGARANRLMSAIEDPVNLRERPRDVSFIIDQLLVNPATRDVADMDRIGVAGHSFGAYTAMAIGGMTVVLPDAAGDAAPTSLRDPRVKAVLPMSPEGPGVMGITDSAWDAFAVPVLFLTGTRDYGAGERSAAWREAGFEHVRHADAYLVTIRGAGHMTFGLPAEHEALIDALGAAFFDATLRDDAAARAWLASFIDSPRNASARSKKPAP